MQWKVLHNIYPTNIFLHKIGKGDNNRCQHCNTIDYIEHFLVECKKVQNLWSEIEKLACMYYSRSIVLATSDILLGYNRENPKDFCYLNKLLLVGKLSVSKFKYGDHPNLLCVFERECQIRKINLAVTH